MNKLFTIIFCLIYVNSIAQDNEQQVDRFAANRKSEKVKSVESKSFKKVPKFVVGSPYLLDTWEKGDVILTTGVSFQGIDLKYDVLNQKLSRITNDGGSLIIHSDIIKSFTIHNNVENKDLHFIRMKNPCENSKIAYEEFYELKYVGEQITLFKKHRKQMQISPLSSNPEATSYEEYVPLDEFYIVTPKRDMWKYKPKKKYVLKNLKNHTFKLHQYIKKEKLDLNKEDDLVALISYFDGL